jgi:hypothetical protein
LRRHVGFWGLFRRERQRDDRDDRRHSARDNDRDCVDGVEKEPDVTPNSR